MNSDQEEENSVASPRGKRKSERSRRATVHEMMWEE